MHSSSGHKHALQEAMSDAKVMARLVDTKAAREVQQLEKFFKLLNDDPDRYVNEMQKCHM